MKSKIVLVVIWLVLAAVFAVRIQIDYFYSDQPASLFPCFALSAIQWAIWSRIVALLLRFSWSNFVGRKLTIQFVLMQIVFGAVVAISVYFLMFLVANSLVKLDWLPAILPRQFSVFFNVVVFVAIVAIVNGIHSLRQNSQLEMQKSQLQAELTNAQLQSLRMQLRPHFLFNVLNSVSMLIEKDPVKARQMIILLGELLRSNLLHDEESFVPLSQEIELIKKYLQIEKIRFGDRINFHFDLETESLSVMIPAMLLQPIVENALYHGCGKAISSGELRIKTRCDKNRLHIQVSDSGNGAPKQEFQERIGLGNTRSRLEKIYDQKFYFEVTSQLDMSTCVQIEIPFSGQQETNNG